MKYYSTSQPDVKVSMREAVTACVPQRGGLYMPDSLPRVPAAFVHNSGNMGLREIAYATTNVFMGSDISSAAIKAVVDNALSFDIPLVNIGDGLYVLELFHGPTNVFKDIGARFLSGFFESLNPHDGTKLNVLVSTTGNTGLAVADAFGGKEDINVFILFPHGVVSRADAIRMKAAGDNICPIEIGGTIDNCKAIVAAAFADAELREKMLITTANSTNFARLMPQVALFFYGLGRLERQGLKASETDVAVPSGNLGMLTSGLMAKRIGLQCNRLIAGCNANNSFDRFVRTGDFHHESTIATYARLMDMSSPSNMPRLMALCGGSLDQLRSDITSATVNDDQIIKTIRETFDKTGYIADPHTAVAIAALDSRVDKSRPALVMSTASPSKSPEVMKLALGENYVDNGSATDIQSLNNTRIDKLAPTYPAFKKYLLSHQ